MHDLTSGTACASFLSGGFSMPDRSIEPVPSAFKRQAGQTSDVPRKRSKETADKLFMVMMRDQGRFGIGRARLSSHMVGMLANYRNAMRRR